MEEIKNLKRIKKFISTLENAHVESTGASVVNNSNNLYNVDGSTNDPKKIPGHHNEDWKPLLIAYGINSNCYVTNPGASGSHPNFSVGGHMTENASGDVDDGGTCYLMPLCYWHNNKARDGVEFTHTNTKMLQLTGYNLAELRVTFELRLPSDQKFAVLYYHEEEWKFKNISQKEANNVEEIMLKNITTNQPIEHYILIERVKIEEGEKTVHKVITSTIPY